MADFGGIRRGYAHGELDESSAAPTWVAQFRGWFDEAVALIGGDHGAAAIEVNAMQVATVDAQGRPDIRTVLLKGLDERGVVFYTNSESATGRQLAAHPYAAAVLAWPSLERQVRIRGPVEQVSRAETESYFATRPRGSQIGAWASAQSQVVLSRQSLDDAARAIGERFGGDDIPAPPHWGGYRISPDEVEFWQGRADRMHDRLRYRRMGKSAWVIERLAP